MKLPNSYYAKYAADWFRSNVEKPSVQDFDIQDTDFFLIHKDDKRLIFRAEVYKTLYNIQFYFSFRDEKEARMIVKKIELVHDGIARIEK